MRRLAAAVAAVSIVAAMPAVASAGDAESCGLLKRKEITRELGQRARAGNDDLVEGLCQWRLVPTADRSPGQVNAMIERGADATRDFRLASRLVGAEPVEGLGRKAVFNPDSGTVFVLLAGPTLFYVQANVYDGDQVRLAEGLREHVTALAAKAEARL